MNQIVDAYTTTECFPEPSPNLFSEPVLGGGTEQAELKIRFSAQVQNNIFTAGFCRQPAVKVYFHSGWGPEPL
jgi:hypothetical protein